MPARRELTLEEFQAREERRREADAAACSALPGKA